MSELINNNAIRKEKLKNIIKGLHREDSDFDALKAEFEKMTKEISATEIAAIEQELVSEGLKIEDIQALCDVHASLFKGSIEEIHQPFYHHSNWHPVQVINKENRNIEAKLKEINNNLGNNKLLLPLLLELKTIEIHYAKKENLIFPLMEKHDITAPPKVMWGVDDEIREKIKVAIALVKDDKDATLAIKMASDGINEMIFKEENIMLPMINDKFTEEDWAIIKDGTKDFGYTLIDENEIVDAEETSEQKSDDVVQFDGVIACDSDTRIAFDCGTLSAKEINAIFNTIPLDMTFVGSDELVKYFSNGSERIFARTKAILGREVKNCHPPKSVHIVEQIVSELANNTKSHEDFWINLGPVMAHIRYYAIRDKDNNFLGVLELSQDIKPIRELEGEKRLVDNPSDL